MLLTLGLGLASLALGFGLLRLEHAHVPEGKHLSPLGALPRELAALEPVAWLSLGVVLLLVTALARLVGMLVEFLGRGDRRAAASAAIVIALLVVAVARGML